MTAYAAVAPNRVAATGFPQFFARVTACHVVTYFVAGVLAYTLADYRTLFQSGALASFMRPIESPWVALGPALQVVRGLVFALALYPFRGVFLDAHRGWLKLWGLLVGLAILSTAGPSPGSLEGIVYTQVTLASHLRGLPEVVLQTAAFSFLLTAWYQRPRRAWTVIMSIAVGLIVLLSIAGAVLPRQV